MITPVVFGDHKFGNRHECVRACKKIIARYQVSQELPLEDQLFFAQLFTLHPDYEEKAGCGIKSIRFGHDSTYGTKCLIIMRFDQTEAAISWGNCLQSPKKKYRIQRAFRNAVVSEVNAFKTSAVFNPVFCFISGERLGFVNSRVIYNAELSFNELVGQFLASLGLAYTDIELHYADGFGEVSTISLDERLACQWRAYHKEKAVMTLVSADLGINPNQVTHKPLTKTSKAEATHG